MKIEKASFGRLASGEEITLWTLKAGDLCLRLSDFGANWLSLCTPDRTGKHSDILLGFSTLEGYLNDKTFQGATIGRFANRIGRGRFSLGGRTYELPKNDGAHCLHGGLRGFGKQVWESDAYSDSDGVYARFELQRPDGDEGFPGKINAVVTYGLTKDNALKADYFAKLSAASPVNLTNHSYFNLKGEGGGKILDHIVTIQGSAIAAVDEELIPTGKLNPVEGNQAFDFRNPKPVAKDMKGLVGYDHCWTIDGEAGVLRKAAEVYESGSGRVMKLSTTQPSMQFYTGNFLDNIRGKSGAVYNIHDGFCLETQHYPDSPNRPDFPSAIFGPDRDYHEVTVFSFGVRSSSE